MKPAEESSGLPAEVARLIDFALAEDLRSGDITTTTLVPSEAKLSAVIFFKQGGVLAGAPFLEAIFHKLDSRVQVVPLQPEGTYVKAGNAVVSLSGPAQAILMGERTALNLLQHASMVATNTATYVKKISGYHCAIMDTRKTNPGLRALEKYAVRAGGGVNHRFGLDDRLVIKSNHLHFMSSAGSFAIAQAVALLKSKAQQHPLEIEIADIALLDSVLEADISAVMLRNMSLEQISKCMKKIRLTAKKAYVESPAITLDTVRAYAATGVDGISIGDLSLTLSDLDMGWRFVPQPSKN